MHVAIYSLMLSVTGSREVRIYYTTGTCVRHTHFRNVALWLYMMVCVITKFGIVITSLSQHDRN